MIGTITDVITPIRWDPPQITTAVAAARTSPTIIGQIDSV